MVSNYETILNNLVLEGGKHIVLTAENRALIRNSEAVLGDRFIDTGITEQCMIGMAAGLALRGKIPVVHALASFLILRPFEFIRTDIGIANLNVKLSGFIPGFLSDANGPTHQALEDISLMRGIPGMQVFAPADEDDLLKCIPEIWNSPFPSYVRINIRKNNFIHDPNFSIGKAEVISAGDDVTFLVYGLLFEQVMEASQILREQAVSVGVINLRSLKPIDENAIIKAAESSHLLVAVEDHFATGGLFSILAEVFIKKHTAPHILSLSMPDKWFRPALLQSVLEHEGFTGAQIASRVNEKLSTISTHKSQAHV